MTDKQEEWLKRNKKLANDMECYCDEYRARKCSSCNLAKKSKRKCREYASGRTYCEPMMISRTRKFKETISLEIKNLIEVESEPRRLEREQELYIAM